MQSEDKENTWLHVALTLETAHERPRFRGYREAAGALQARLGSPRDSRSRAPVPARTALPPRSRSAELARVPGPGAVREQRRRRLGRRSGDTAPRYGEVRGRLAPGTIREGTGPGGGSAGHPRAFGGGGGRFRVAAHLAHRGPAGGHAEGLGRREHRPSGPRPARRLRRAETRAPARNAAAAAGTLPGPGIPRGCGLSSRPAPSRPTRARHPPRSKMAAAGTAPEVTRR